MWEQKADQWINPKLGINCGQEEQSHDGPIKGVDESSVKIDLEIQVDQGKNLDCWKTVPGNNKDEMYHRKMMKMR